MSSPTREILWGVPPWAEVLWYVLAVISVGVFADGVARPLSKYLRGRRDTLPPLNQLWPRTKKAARIVAAQSTIARRDKAAGWAHRGIFYGFLVLFIGTVILAINTDFTEPIFGWRFFEGDFYLGYSLVLDVIGIALLGGVLVMMIRRGIVKPKKLEYTAPAGEEALNERRSRYRVGDWIFVGGLLYLVLGGYLLEGLRFAMDGGAHGGYSPFGWLCGQAIDAFHFSNGTLGVFRRIVWWGHGLVALAFVAAIPYTKAVHMLVDFVSLILRDDEAGKRLRPIPAARSDDPAGYATLADFSVQHLLQLDACTKCGKCHEACPANATGLPLSPRDVVLELREEANEAMRGAGLDGVLGSLLHRAEGGEVLDVGVVGEEKVRVETLWSCMQCNACVEICPVGIEQAPIINQLRRHLVEEGELPRELQATLKTVHKNGNSFGESKRKRGRWARDLPFEVRDARKEPVDILWFVGDYASFEPRSQEISRNLATLLHRAGIDFGILYDGERTAGNDIRRVGEEGLFEMLAEENVASLAGCEFNRILTTDPHSLNTLRREYPDFGGEAWEIVHHSSLLVELLESGALGEPRPIGKRVTYHDPCHLGRFNGEFDNPRRILELIGCELIEMPRNRDNSFCCGAGGGKIWVPDTPGTERPSENRIAEAVGLGELDHFVVSCPKDVTMYDAAIKSTGHEGDLTMMEITELVLESVGEAGEPEPLGEPLPVGEPAG